MDSSSSDSDANGKIRNIRSTLVKSENSHQEIEKKYAYKRKLGDLVFDANFEAGNLGHVERVNRYEYDLMVRPDVANPRSRLWFNFTVSNQSPGQCVVFTFVNLSEKIRLFHEGLTPVVRSKLVPSWQRLHEDQVFYYKSPDHGDRYVLSIAFRFSSYENDHQFATFYPYPYTNLISFTTRWTVEIKRKQRSTKIQSKEQTERIQSNYVGKMPTKDHDNQLRPKSSLGFNEAYEGKEFDLSRHVQFEVSSLGMSILSKLIYRLSIKDPPTTRKKPIVVVLCRSCGNIDSVASLVCQGFIDYILSNNFVSKCARKYIDFECIPFMDPDSSCVGNSGTDLMGQTSPSTQSMKANKCVYSSWLAIHKMIESLCSEAERIVIIEVKVNLNLIGSRILGTRYNEAFRMERHLALPRIISRFANDFYLENCVFLSQFKRSVMFPIDFESRLNVDQYRLEVSPFAFYKRSVAHCKYEEYNQRQYLSLGKALVFSLLEVLRPKDQSLPYCVATIIDSFHPRADDVDSLLLRLRRTD